MILYATAMNNLFDAYTLNPEKKKILRNKYNFRKQMNLGRLLDIIWPKIGELNENEKDTIFSRKTKI